MSDKVQLIKQEIERRIENLSYLIPDISNIGNLTMEDVGYYAKSEALKSILQFIDSLPEESESKDRINECPHWDKDWGCETSPMNNCDSCPQAKWVEAKKEKKNYNERYNRIAQTEQFKESYCDKSLGKEESGCEVNFTTKNENLEKEIKSWIPAHIEGGDEYLRKVAIEWSEIVARHFTEWQKHQMMKDAVNGEVVYQIGSAEIAPIDIRYKVVSDRVYIPNVKLGDKVKIIILKEEQQ